MASVEARPKPVLHPEFCKGCGRCIEACTVHHCIAEGQEIHALSGLVPVAFHPAECNGCNLCVEACPEPYALMAGDADPPVEHPVVSRQRAPAPAPVPDERVALAEGKILVVKGAHAAAIGALLAGCRHFFGYPITPSTEGAELMAKLLPKLGGTFLQAVSEVAAVNMMYGCGGGGKPCMTFTSSPGFSLMLEGVSYLIGSEIPGVIVNVMRAGPGLGNIGPAQADIKLTCRGLGHGATHAIALAPSTPQEMLDHAMLAFELSFKYRNPVVILADGYLGQMTGRVELPGALVRPGLPAWAVSGDAAHRKNVHTSIYLNEGDQEAHDEHILAKYAAMTEAEQRADLYRCEDAEVLLVACNTPARMAKGAVRALRDEGVAAGLFRPQTVWPFPVKALLPLLGRVRRLVVVEASEGQLEDELRLALSHAGTGQSIPIDHVRRQGGNLPSQREILEGVRGPRPVRASARKVVTA
jgi:pyruvate/2-oxoacid:ferredoxin oxidoreductase alpha subunit/NAD-dependent dihydropyrimidine dehydrogenase PreA subunit